MSGLNSDETNKKPLVISLVNFKGGVGKTSLAVNLAATLAFKFQKRLLLIDADAQANASIWCMGVEAWKKRMSEEGLARTVFQLILDAKNQTNDFDFEESVVSGSEVLKDSAPGLDLLPSTYKMMFAEQLVLESQTTPRTRILKNGLQDYVAEYDIVIIDCPPNTYYVTQNALSMSDYILVPMIPDFLSAVGFQELIERLHGLAPILEMRTPLPILGIIANSYTRTLSEHKTAVAQIRGLVNKLQNGKKVQNRVTLFEPFISRAIAMSNAARRGLPVHGTGTPGGNRLAMEFNELGASILREMSAKS